VANTLTASLRESWSRDYQDTAEKTNVFSNISNYRLESILTKGQQAHRPYMSDIVVNTLSSEGAYTRQDITSTDEYLTVDQEKEASFYIDFVSSISNGCRKFLYMLEVPVKSFVLAY